jgi:hypothetical protein
MQIEVLSQRDFAYTGKIGEKHLIRYQKNKKLKKNGRSIPFQEIVLHFDVGRSPSKSTLFWVIEPLLTGFRPEMVIFRNHNVNLRVTLCGRARVRFRAYP